jgi:hypothetical protein
MIAHLLVTELEVWRPSTVTDAVGGQTVTRALVATVRASVSQPTAAERQLGERWGADLDQVVYLDASVDVRRGDELAGVIPSGVGDARLRVLDVTRNSRTTYTRADCEAIQAEGAS